MTVKRKDSGQFNAPKEQLLSSILRILKSNQRKYSYVDTEVDSDASEVRTRIKPNFWPLLLSTGMDIQIEGGDTVSSVVVSTQSQWFIFGDVFNFYNGYIKDMLSSLRSEMGKNAEQ